MDRIRLSVFFRWNPTPNDFVQLVVSIEIKININKTYQ
ncbi:MAG: hypothetical protein ACJAZP_003452 [Psychromonas sp.]|jgi:hypothetical protein